MLSSTSRATGCGNSAIVHVSLLAGATLVAASLGAMSLAAGVAAAVYTRGPVLVLET